MVELKTEGVGDIQIRRNGELFTYDTIEEAWKAFEEDPSLEKLSFPFCGTRLILRRDESCVSGLRAEMWASKEFGLEKLAKVGIYAEDKPAIGAG